MTLNDGDVIGGTFIPHYKILLIRRCMGCNRDVAATNDDGHCAACEREKTRMGFLR